ncbi:MAG: hypothetical protein R3A52_15940 [Polyangiales bacterium]
MTLQTGTILDSRYELLARLDDFGRGASWYARDTRLKNRFVVVKVLDAGASSRGPAPAMPRRLPRCATRTCSLS